ncbi:hypothetical protein Mgra_00000106 [Meloidogyne graminicola]|uniref:Inositol 1,4,5-trisphosphate receptor n=1 Tax=Meloidogyne graminicola TaxID=189291 RepID=A0A8T0A4H6_9BILA|nr:hypothetical protein Mgra_00000106 [Meloidogyne graminicola]
MVDRFNRLCSICSPDNSFDLFRNTHLHIGDVISLYVSNSSRGENGHEGFLSTLGLVDERCVVVEGHGNLQSPPETFRDCLFLICPINKYSAQKQLWMEQKRYQQQFINNSDTYIDEEMLKKVENAAEKEKEQNKNDYKKMLGNIIQYGSSIQLLHVKSNKFLTMQKNSPARQERNAMRIYLDKLGNEGSWFFIEPAYKHVSLGDNVMSGERIVLVSYTSHSNNISSSSSLTSSSSLGPKIQLHLSQHRLTDHKNCWEINCLNEQTEWQANIFLQYDENIPENIKSGDVLRLFHADQQTFLTLDSEHKNIKNNDKVFLRLTNRPSATDATSSRALWEIQIFNREMPLRGGALTWRKFIRFKHLATDQYLTNNKNIIQFKNISENENNLIYLLIPKHSEDPCRDEDILFMLDPCTKIQTKESRVQINSYVRFQHVKTNTWVHSTNPQIKSNLYYSSKNERGWVKVICEPFKIDKEAFSLSPVIPNEVRDLDFANDACKTLNQFVNLIKNGKPIGKEEIKVITQLLIDCVYFVTGIINNQLMIDPLKIINYEPLRDRQKLLREQGVLTQIFNLQKAPFLPRQGNGEVHPLLSAPSELNEQRNECFLKIFQLSYSLLLYSQCGYRKNQEFLAEKFDHIQEHIGFNLLAEETMTAVLHNNPKLLEKYVKIPHVERFVELVRNNRCGKFLFYLADLCVCRGEANKKIQELICNCVLNEKNREIFMLTEKRYLNNLQDFEVYICWGYSGSKCSSLINCSKLIAEKDEKEMFNYYKNQLELFSQLCQEQQYLAIDPPPERKLLNISQQLPIDLVIKCISDNRLPFDIRASFCRLMLHLHIIRGSPVPSIRHARLWRDIPKNVEIKKYYTSSTLEFYKNNEYNNNSIDSNISTINEFHQEILLTVENYLSELCTNNNNNKQQPILLDLPEYSDQNRLTFEIINLAKSLAQFGFYDFEQMLSLIKYLLIIVDNCPTKINLIKENNSFPPNTLEIPTKKQQNNNKIINSTSKDITEDSTNSKRSKEMVLKTKLIVVELIDFIMDIRRDFRVTKALSFYKNLLSCNENGEIKEVPVISKELIQKLFNFVFIDSEEKEELDMDKNKGQQLLRILLQMTMIEDFPTLTSISLKLLFRHFNQFQELIEDMKQIQLLVSNQDIKNYHQIDKDLFILKQLTEKSEIWVHYGNLLENNSITSCSSPSNPSQDRSDDDFIHESLSIPSIEILQEKVSIGNESPTTKRRKTLKNSRNNTGILQQPSPQTSIIKNNNAAIFSILQQYYPKILQQEDQLASIGFVLIGGGNENNNDSTKYILKNKIELSNILNSIMEKTPLICYLLIKEILVKLKDLCFSGSSSNNRNQQLLRNMLVYEVILQFLNIPFDHKNDNEMPKLLTLSHEFLRSFCKNNKENQKRLYLNITSIEGSGGGGGGNNNNITEQQQQQQRHEVQDCSTIVSIFKGNSELCEHISEHFIAHIVNLIENKQKNSIFLELLQVIVSSCDKGLDLCQNKVVDEIGKAAEDVRYFYVDIIEMMQNTKSSELDSIHPLRYHIELVKLMALCTKGKNAITELKCASLLPMDHIVRVLTSKVCILEVKTVYLQFLLTCYIETDLELKDANNSEYLELILNEIIEDIDKLLINLQGIINLNNKYNSEIISLEKFVCQIITEVLIQFFERSNYIQKAFIDIKHHQKLFNLILQKLIKLQNFVFIASGRRPNNNWYKIADCCERLTKFAKINLLITNNNNTLNIPEDNSNNLRTITARQRWQSAIFSARYIQRNNKLINTKSLLITNKLKKELITVVELYPHLINELNNFILPLQYAENSTLVEILRLPEKLLNNSFNYTIYCSEHYLSSFNEYFCNGKCIKKMLIKHCKLLLELKKNELCGKVLITLYKLILYNKHKINNKQVKDILYKLLCQYFGDNSIQGGGGGIKLKKEENNYNNLIKNNDYIFDENLNPKQINSLYNIQCDLMDAGAVDLIIDLIIMEPSYDILRKSIQLAKALLLGGNYKVQMLFFEKLQNDQKLTSKFFNALKQKIQTAQNRIKNDILNGTSNSGRTTTIFSTLGSRPSAAVTPNTQNGNWLINNSTTNGIVDFKQQHQNLSPKNSLNNTNELVNNKNNLFQNSSSPLYKQQINSESEEKIIIPILPIEVSIIEPILRFLQLLCENHNFILQNFLRTQRGKPDFNLVAETLTFLDCICGSTKGSLGVFAEIGEHNVSIVTQTLISLTEFCQGPCYENQNCLARHESNGMDIVISLVLNDIRPLADQRMDLALEIKSQASKLLLAIMESRDDSENAERIIRLMLQNNNNNNLLINKNIFKQLIKAISNAYLMSLTYYSPLQQTEENIIFETTKNEQNIFKKYLFNLKLFNNNNKQKKPEICLSSNNENNNNLIIENKQIFNNLKNINQNNNLVNPKEVGHNIYILSKQLSRHNKELNNYLDPNNSKDENIKEALTFYQKHTGQIEIVRSVKKMERVLFPINDICEFLTNETKHSIFINTEKDAQGSKINDFFDKWPNLYNEMKWQKKLQDKPLLNYFTKRLHLWSRICFFLSILLNLILAISYPFEHSQNSVLIIHLFIYHFLLLFYIFYFFVHLNVYFWQCFLHQF